MRSEEGRSVTLRGSVYAVSGSTLFLKQDDGRVVVVDISKLPSTEPRLKRGSSVALIAVPVGNKFQATGLVETETGTSGATSARPAR